MATLSTPTAVGLCTLHTVLYLSSIYVLPSTRIPPPPPPPPSSSSLPLPPPTAPLTRNSPTIIRRRLIAVSLSTATSLFLLSRTLPPSSPSFLSAAGLSLLSTRTISECARLVVLPLGLTMSLFSGSLLVAGLRGELVGVSEWSKEEAWKEFGGWVGARTYLMGPLTEELVFRSCVVAVSHFAGWSKAQIVFLTPIYFGLAHVHHAYEVYVTGGRTAQALKMGVLQSTFQFAYTTLFGWYAAFLFMRTGSVIPPVLAHSFCNLMGLPPLYWALKDFPERKIALWSTYIGGIAVFVYGFWRWTEPSLYGGSMYWK
ncbi:hypothetical protein RQP46_008258 [Phenoliferia psychrophenolica]